METTRQLNQYYKKYINLERNENRDDQKILKIFKYNILLTVVGTDVTLKKLYMKLKILNISKY